MNDQDRAAFNEWHLDQYGVLPEMRCRQTQSEHSAFAAGLAHARKQQEERVCVHESMIHLVRFLCATYAEIDSFVHKYCSGEALMRYPVVQGTSNQIRLKRIGEQAYDSKRIHEAVAYMLESDCGGRVEEVCGDRRNERGDGSLPLESAQVQKQDQV